MARLFSAATQRIVGDSQDYQDLIIIQNELNSGVNVHVRRLTVQRDMLATQGSFVFVPTITYRGIGSPNLFGSCLLGKAPFDTTIASDPQVKVWGNLTPDGIGDGGFAGIAGASVWRQWTPRIRSEAEQQIATDANQLPGLIRSTNFTLKPGEYITIRADPIGTIDNTVNSCWFAQTVWEEVAIATHTISGTVTLAGSAVAAAEVTVLVADNETLTNAFLHSIVTTSVLGAWSANVPDGKFAYAYASNYATGTYYTAEGRPFIT